MKLLIAHSDDIDTPDAMAEVLARIRDDLDGLPPVAGLLFCGEDYDHHAIIAALGEAYPGMPFIGCTADGEMSSAGGYVEDGLLLAVFAGDGLRAYAGTAGEAGEAPDVAAAEALAGLDFEPTVAFTTPASVTANGDAMVRALNAALPEDCLLAGGTAADHGSMERTRQFSPAGVGTDQLNVLCLGGLRGVAVARSGWTPLSERFVASETEGRILRRLDGKSASLIFREVVGEVNELGLLGEFPVAVFPEPDSDEHYLRTVFSIDDESGSLTTFGEIPEGAEVRLTQVSREGVLQGTRDGLSEALDQLGGPPEGALVIGCAARKWMLGQQVAAEARVVAERLEGIPFGGFYSFGEIAPARACGPARFHNETVVTVLLRAA